MTYEFYKTARPRQSDFYVRPSFYEGALFTVEQIAYIYMYEQKSKLMFTYL